jgi:hypothetical protein
LDLVLGDEGIIEREGREDSTISDRDIVESSVVSVGLFIDSI